MIIRKKKRIMHVAECAIGVDRYLSLLLPRLNDEFEIILVCSQQYDVHKWMNMVDHIEIVNMENKLSLIRDVHAAMRLRTLIRKYKPDILYLHSSKAGGIGRIANIGLCKIVLYNAHGWSFKDKSKRLAPIFLLLERLLASLTTKIITISEFERSIALKKNICCDEKVIVIKNGIDTSEYNGIQTITRKDLKIPQNAFLIGAVGRITYGKSPDFFIKVANELLQKIPDSYFILIGDGELKDEINNLAKDLGIQDHLIITGWVNDVRQYIKLLNVGVLFTRWEGFGYALTEYMLEGIPVIGTNIDAIPELVINGKNGFLIEIESIDEAIEKLTILYKNPQLREEMSYQGRMIVKNFFDAKRTVDEHRELFNLLLKPLSISD